MRLTITFLILCCLAFAEKRAVGPRVDGNPLYSPIGKRDPFKPPSIGLGERNPDSLDALERFSIDQLKLRAILRGLGSPKAMFEDPEKKTHIISEGDFIGREKGTVSRILNTDVIVTEKTFNYLGAETLYERVISLPED